MMNPEITLSDQAIDRDDIAAPRRLLPPRLTLALVLLIPWTLSGCAALFSPISGVPSHRLPPQFHAKPKNNLVPVEVYRLQQDPPAAYLLDAGDILGIWIQGVLGNEGEEMPFQMPEKDSDLPPSIGYPVVVREDGTVSLPFVTPIPVRGLTVRQTENTIRRAYTVDRQILQPGKDRMLVSLMRERTYRVIVLRRDGDVVSHDSESRGDFRGNFRRAEQEIVHLPAYQNDVLNALAATGGLPGLSAKNEVLILRGRLLDAKKRGRFVRAFYERPPCDPCLCMPPIPNDPAIIRIPLRLPPGVTPTIRPEDVVLENGDIVMVEQREREVYYTAGMLDGGEHELPRDYDLDVVTAIAKAGYIGAGAGGNTGGVGGIGGLGGSGLRVPPTQVFILRKTPCGDQITIAVDLVRAIRSPGASPLVQAGDVLVLQNKPIEDLTNFGSAAFFTYGIRELFRSN